MVSSVFLSFFYMDEDVATGVEIDFFGILPMARVLWRGCFSSVVIHRNISKIGVSPRELALL